MATILALALAGVGGVAGVVALVATFVKKEGGGQALGKAVQGLPTYQVNTKSATFNAALNPFMATVEAAFKATVTGDRSDAFLAFLTTKPSPAQVLVWLEQNAGAPFVDSVEAATPALLQQEITVLGHDLPSVVQIALGKLLPDLVSHLLALKGAAASQPAPAAKPAPTQAQTLAALTALTEPKPSPVAPATPGDAK